MHPAHRIRHAVARGTCRHIIGVKRSARATAGSHGEILLAIIDAPFLIRARNGMLEARGVRAITRDGDVHAFVTHDRHTFADVIRAIAAYLAPLSVAIRRLFDDLELAGLLVEVVDDIDNYVLSNVVVPLSLDQLSNQQ